MGDINNGINNFRNDAVNIHQSYPDLKYIDQDGLPTIEGKIILLDEDGNFIDNYHVKIIPTTNYPFSFPYVFEVGSRLPHNIEWHVFRDGHCCIRSIPDELYICRNGLSLPYFINDQLIPYFFNQKYRELQGYFLHERSHRNGDIEFFEEIFKTKNLHAILEGLKLLLSNKKPDRVSKCFCGSGKKYRKCHRSIYLDLFGAYSDIELHTFINKVSANLMLSQV